MLKTKIFLISILLVTYTLILFAKESSIPFPNLKKPDNYDPEVGRLLSFRIKKHNDMEGHVAEGKLVAMGTEAVPTLIYLAKKAANSDQRILNPEKYQDYGWELLRPIHILSYIGDRRAIPLISSLVKYDYVKASRMRWAIAEIVCHGSDEQILDDTKSEDPNVAEAAKWILRDPLSSESCRRRYRKESFSKRIFEDYEWGTDIETIKKQLIQRKKHIKVAGNLILYSDKIYNENCGVMLVFGGINNLLYAVQIAWEKPLFSNLLKELTDKYGHPFKIYEDRKVYEWGDKSKGPRGENLVWVDRASYGTGTELHYHSPAHENPYSYPPKKVKEKF